MQRLTTTVLLCAGLAAGMGGCGEEDPGFVSTAGGGTRNGGGDDGAGNGGGGGEGTSGGADPGTAGGGSPRLALSWEQVESGPPPMFYPAMAYDEAGRRLVVFGQLVRGPTSSGSERTTAGRSSPRQATCHLRAGPWSTTASARHSCTWASWARAPM